MSRGRGFIQKFIDRQGGVEWLAEQYEKYGSCNEIARMIFNKWGINCVGNTIRVYMAKNNMKINPIGGDRRTQGWRKKIKKTK